MRIGVALGCHIMLNTAKDRWNHGMRRPRLRWVCFVLLLAAGCDYESKTIVPAPDKADFEARAYPVLMRDCAFAGCHGDSDRLLQVYGPGRTRISADLETYDPPTKEEIDASYSRARSFLQHDGDIRNSLLLHKPIQGSAHFAIDNNGRNVYQGGEDPGFQTLLSWARGDKQ